MEASDSLALASLVVAALAFFLVLIQLKLEISVEQRRKGKTDKLALGDWAISWPTSKLVWYYVSSPFRRGDDWSDPRQLSVPFITVAAMETYLRNEAKAMGRPPLARRNTSRLVVEASNEIATGGGAFTGRMYAVRETTRKRSEACWSDAMDMCGMTRKHWDLLCGASAQACDGQIRPANAVTNLHSLWGFSRTMGLGICERQKTKVTFLNGGASIYLDQYLGPDRPTRLAHFSGSPNGRYKIIEEMSQHTGPSVYADTVWSSGCIPSVPRLEICRSMADIAATPEKGKKPDIAKEHLVIPEDAAIPTALPKTTEGDSSSISEKQWSDNFFGSVRMPSYSVASGDVPLGDFVGRRNASVISCIKTYPRATLNATQLKLCGSALLWCVENWRSSPYEVANSEYRSDDDTPRLPTIGSATISCEFVTDADQATLWCQEALGCGSKKITNKLWQWCERYISNKIAAADGLNSFVTLEPSFLSSSHRLALLKFLQCWKLFIITSEEEEETDRAVLSLLTMALIAIANDSSLVGDDEINKAMEVELG